MGAARTARGSYLQSLQRSILVLDLVSTSPVGMSARELAEAANLDRTVTHRVIRTLEREELLVKQSNRFVLGPRALLLGNRYLAQSAAARRRPAVPDRPAAPIFRWTALAGRCAGAGR